jgi:hypothetical protein
MGYVKRNTRMSKRKTRGVRKTRRTRRVKRNTRRVRKTRSRKSRRGKRRRGSIINIRGGAYATRAVSTGKATGMAPEDAAEMRRKAKAKLALDMAAIAATKATAKPTPTAKAASTADRSRRRQEVRTLGQLQKVFDTWIHHVPFHPLPGPPLSKDVIFRMSLDPHKCEEYYAAARGWWEGMEVTQEERDRYIDQANNGLAFLCAWSEKQMIEAEEHEGQAHRRKQQPRGTLKKTPLEPSKTPRRGAPSKTPAAHGMTRRSGKTPAAHAAASRQQHRQQGRSQQSKKKGPAPGGAAPSFSTAAHAAASRPQHRPQGRSQQSKKKGKGPAPGRAAPSFSTAHAAASRPQYGHRKGTKQKGKHRAPPGAAAPFVGSPGAE